MYAFNDNNCFNDDDYYSNFIINIIQKILSDIFDSNDSLNKENDIKKPLEIIMKKENIKNTWKINICRYQNSNNITSFLFCDLSFLYLVCFVQGVDLNLVESLRMFNTFRSKLLASLITNKVNELFSETYNTKFESEYSNSKSIIDNNLDKISTAYNAMSGATEHFRRLEGCIKLFIIYLFFTIYYIYIKIAKLKQIM
jgi:hypothetical protein